MGSELSAPLPLSAAVDTAAQTWGVVFDQPLLTGPIFAANWRFTGPGSNWAATTAVALEHHVGGAMIPIGFPADPIVLNYDATPADLKSAASVPAAPIVAFPLT